MDVMQFITTTENGIKLIHLKEDGKTLMTVAPEVGGRLKTLNLKKGDKLHELLWPVSIEDLKTNDWYKNTILFPYPNRLENGTYTFEGNSYSFPINEPDKNNQLHGMLYNEAFTVTEELIEGDTASLELSYAYDGSQDYYPFSFLFLVKYTYGPSGFTVDFHVTNTSKEKLPFGLGWHPYFQIDGNSIDHYFIETPNLEVIELSERSIPTGTKLPYNQNPIDLKEIKLDHAFKISAPKNVYQLKDSKSGVTLLFTASEAFDFMQIFTPNMEAVAIEPMTCNINALNNRDGLKTLESNESFRGKFEIAIA